MDSDRLRIQCSSTNRTAVPVICSAVKARQARKNVEVGMRGYCFSLNPTNFIGFGLGLWSASVQSFPIKIRRNGFREKIMSR
jgi:hypothetical protein